MVLFWIIRISLLKILENIKGLLHKYGDYYQKLFYQIIIFVMEGGKFNYIETKFLKYV